MKYKNPILPGADPFVLHHKDKYYLYSTLYKDGIKVFESTDGINFSEKGVALDKNDTFGTEKFWAPELLYRDGTFYMVFVANEHLGIATSKSPLGPFIQKDKKPLDDDNMIDGHFLEAFDGNTYLYYVRFRHGGNEIAVAKMNDDLLSVDFSTEKIVLTATEPWELKDCYVAEGPFVLKHNNKYYLTYSCNHTRSPEYAVGCAISDSPFGPFVKCKNNPILYKKGNLVGVGHHSFALDDDNNLLIYYHCHESLNKMGQRQTCVNKAYFKDDLLYIDGPKEEN